MLVPILMFADPDRLILVAPVTDKPAPAVRRPPSVSLSPAVAVVIVWVALSLEKYPMVPLLVPVILPLHVMFPFDPSIVHPVSVDPPARLIRTAAGPVAPIPIVDADWNALIEEALVLNRLSVPVADDVNE